MSQRKTMHQPPTGGVAVDSTLGGGGAPQECNEEADGSNSTWEDMLKSWSGTRTAWRCLNLIQCLQHEHSSECNIVTTKVGLHRIMMQLAFSDDADVREAALRCLLVLARVEGGGNSDQLVKNDDKLKQVLQELIIGINAMAPEDLGAAREEIQLVDSLWNACYNDPSSLREKGLFVLPGEDLCDLASKLFEPSPRALAAADRKSVAEKKKAPFLV